jgi:hypothetical protein
MNDTFQTLAPFSFEKINSLRWLFIVVWAVVRLLLLLLWGGKKEKKISFYISFQFVSSKLLFLFYLRLCLCGAAADWRISCNARASAHPPWRTSYVVQSSPSFFLLPSGAISSRRRETVALAPCDHQDVSAKQIVGGKSFFCLFRCPLTYPQVWSYLGVFGFKWTDGGQELCAQFF